MKPHPLAAPSSTAWLDTLRGLAATAVVFFHLNEVRGAPQPLYRAGAKLGWLGVPVFFAISGYVITLAARRRPDWRTFALRRWWRIYPPNVASVALVLGVAVVRKLVTGVNDVPNLPHHAVGWFAVLTLTAYPVTSLPDINWVYWTLSCEMAFCAAVALLLAVRPGRIGAGIAVISALCLLPGIPAPLRFFSHHWWQFAVGATLAMKQEPLARGVVWIAAAAGAWHLHEIMPAAAVLLTAGTIAFALTPSGAWLNRGRLFARVGLVSYSLYLVHVPIGVCLLTPLAPSRLSFPAHLACDLALYALCLAAAWLFWAVAENPAHEYGRYCANRPVMQS